MANLAKWTGIDAFELNEISLGGSGYDYSSGDGGNACFVSVKLEK